MSEESTKSSKKNPWKTVLLVIGILLAGGAAGYYIGTNNAESDLQKKYDEQVQKLQDELDDARQNVSGTLEESQDALTEGQQTLESVQADNAALQATIDQQKQQIADLEKQLADAQSDNSTDTPTN
jgi:predicted nuclease with TOPRIM domain